MKDYTSKLLDKALDTIEGAELLLDHEKVDIAAGRAYSPPGKFFPPFLQMSLRGRSSRSNPRLQWETASFLAVTSHLDYWKKLFWTAILCFVLHCRSPVE